MRKQLHIEIGNSFQGNVDKVDSDRVRFVTEDGRTMFEVCVSDKPNRIEVRGVESCRIDGVLFSELLTVRPQCANVVKIETIKYNETA